MSKDEVLTKLTIEELEERFGLELAKNISNELSYCVKEDIEYQIKVISESTVYTSIIFATYAFAYIYKISNLRKTIDEKKLIGLAECDKALKIMKAVDKKQKQLVKRELN